MNFTPLAHTLQKFVVVFFSVDGWRTFVIWTPDVRTLIIKLVLERERGGGIRDGVREWKSLSDR